MGKQPKRGGRQKFSNPEDAESEARGGQQGARGMNNQSSTAGQMPPSDSDSEEEVQPQPQRKVQPGDLPPNSSEDESEEEDLPPKPAPVELTRREREQLEAQKADEPDPEQVAKDLERLALIKKRREEQKAKRIEADGWDRMLPMSETNKPPGMTWPPADAD